MASVSELLMMKDGWHIKTIEPSSTLRASAEALLEFKVGALIVLGPDNGMVGILSERDLVKVVAGHVPGGAAATASDVMTRSVITCQPDDQLASVMRLMNENRIRHIPVLEDGDLVGMLSTREVMEACELFDSESQNGVRSQ